MCIQEPQLLWLAWATKGSKNDNTLDFHFHKKWALNIVYKGQLYHNH